MDNRLARVSGEYFDLVNLWIDLVENFRLVVSIFVQLSGWIIIIKKADIKCLPNDFDKPEGDTIILRQSSTASSQANVPYKTNSSNIILGSREV